MIYDLIYTSAPETLDGPGYGAVQKTAGFPEQLEKLIRQQLNQYVFVTDKTAGGGPVHSAVYSHALLDDRGQQWHVFSRVDFGGNDYTNRAVFFAHHVAIAEGDLGAANVADLVLNPEFFRTHWNGQVGVLPSRRVIVNAGRDGRCEAWRLLAGDPQRARWWVNRWLQQKREPQFLLVPDRQAALGLFAEAIGLMPSPQSQSVRFLTNLASDRSGVHFDWIGLTADSEITHAVIERFPERVVDLRKPLGRLAEGELGSRVLVTEPASAPAKASAKAVAPKVAARQPRKSDREPDEMDLIEESLQLAQAERAARKPAEPKMPPPPPPTEKSRLPIVAAVMGIAILLLAGGGWWVYARTLGSASITAPPVEKKEPSAPATPVTKDDSLEKRVDTAAAASAHGDKAAPPTDKPKPLGDKLPAAEGPDDKDTRDDDAAPQPPAEGDGQSGPKDADESKKNQQVPPATPDDSGAGPAKQGRLRPQDKGDSSASTRKWFEPSPDGAEKPKESDARSAGTQPPKPAASRPAKTEIGFVTRGFSGSQESKATDDWWAMQQFSKDKLPESPRLKLIAQAALQLQSKPLGDLEPSGIQVLDPAEKVLARFRLRKHGQFFLLEWQKGTIEPNAPGNSDDVDRLRLCLLEIVDSEGYPFARIGLTPTVPAGRIWPPQLPLPNEGGDGPAFFAALQSVCKSLGKPPQLRVNIERVSLSILPDGKNKWVSGKSAPDDPNSIPIVVTANPSSEKVVFSGKLKLHANFDGSQKDLPPFRVELQTPSAKKMSPEKEQRIAELAVKGRADACEAVLRQFGELHGSLLIAIEDPNDHNVPPSVKEYELLRFGSGPAAP